MSAKLSLILALFLAAAAHAAPPAQQRTLWSYDKELGLSPQQVSTLKAAVKYMADRITTLRAQQNTQQKAVADLIKADADAAQIRVKARQLLETELELRMLDIETAQKMKRALTPGQLTKWRGIQAQQRAASQRAAPRAKRGR